MKIGRSAMMVLLLGFLTGWSAMGQDKVKITDQITAVKGKIILELPETTSVGPELEAEFSGFFQDLVEELKKQTVAFSLDCQLNLAFDLRVKPKLKVVILTVESKTGPVFQYTVASSVGMAAQRYVVKSQIDEKLYGEYLTLLMEKILKKYVKC